MNKEIIETNFNSEREFKLNGRVLWLTEDPKLVREQLEGADFAFVAPNLLAKNVSTDEIIPSRHCFNYTPQNLGEFALTGFRGDVIKPGDLKRNYFKLVRLIQ